MLCGRVSFQRWCAKALTRYATMGGCANSAIFTLTPPRVSRAQAFNFMSFFAINKFLYNKQDGDGEVS